MSFSNEIKGISDSKHAVGAVYVLGLGLILSDILPTPADGLYFFGERKLRDQYVRGEITPKQYLEKQALIYYGLNPLWWGIILGITVAIKGDARKKLTIMSGLVGAGAVVGVLMNNVKKDVEQQSKESIIVVPKS